MSKRISEHKRKVFHSPSPYRSRKTILEMTSKIQTMESQNSTLVNDYEQRLKISQERAQRLAKEYMVRKKEDQDGSNANLDENQHTSGEALNTDEHRDEHNVAKRIRKKHVRGGKRHHKLKKHKARYPARIAQRRQRRLMV